MDARWSELWSVERRAATATVALGVALFAFNAFVVSTALPSAVGAFGGARWLAWASSLYIICSLVTGPSAALVMHRVGARVLFMAAGGLFLAGTLMAAAAPSIGVLLGGRALQGAAAGFIESGCYVLIPRLFPPRLIGRVFGVEAVAWAAAAFAAPALAGVLAEAVSWRVALCASVPIVVIFLVLVPRVVGPHVPQAATLPGAAPAPGLPLLSLAGLAAGMGLIVLSDRDGDLVWRMLTLAAGVALCMAVVRGDGRRGERLMPKGAFDVRRGLGLGLWITLLMPMSQSASSVFLVYMLVNLWGYSTVVAGLSATVLALSWSFMQTLSAQMPGDRRRLVAVGGVVAVVGQAVMFLAFWQDSTAAMLGAQVLLGAAFGLSWGALSQVVMEEAGADRDQAAGLLPVVFSAGFGLGAAFLGLIANGLGFGAAEGAALQGVMLGLVALAFLLSVVVAGLALALWRGRAAGRRLAT